jgi:hypothetical protein
MLHLVRLLYVEREFAGYEGVYHHLMEQPTHNACVNLFTGFFKEAVSNFGYMFSE